MSTLPVIPTAPRPFAHLLAVLRGALRAGDPSLALRLLQRLGAFVGALWPARRPPAVRRHEVLRALVSLGSLDARTLRDIGLEGLDEAGRARHAHHHGRRAEMPAEFHRGWM